MHSQRPIFIFLLVSLLAFGGIFGWKVHRANLEEKAIEAMARQFGMGTQSMGEEGVEYAYALGQDHNPLWIHPPPPRPDWARKWFGTSFVSPVAYLYDGDLDSPNLDPMRPYRFLGWLPELKRVHLKFRNEDLVELRPLQKLEVLGLIDGESLDHRLSVLQDLSRLRRLEFDICTITESGWKAIEVCEQIQELQLGSSSWNQTASVHVQKMTQLREVTLEGGNCTGEDLYRLLGHPTMKSLKLNSVTFDPAPQPALVSMLKHIYCRGEVPIDALFAVGFPADAELHILTMNEPATPEQVKALKQTFSAIHLYDWGGNPVTNPKWFPNAPPSH